MRWFSYHGKAKKLIASGKLCRVQFFESYNKISPAMVLFFYGEKPMPIRQYRWKEYFEILNTLDEILYANLEEKSNMVIDEKQTDEEK